MADEDINAIAAVILPWVSMPNSATGPTNGRPWTPDENAAYNAAGGWTEGTDAARAVRSRTIATEILAALTRIRPDDQFGRNIIEENERLGQALTETRRALGWATVRTDYEWATQAIDGPDAGQILPQTSEITARDWHARHGGELLRRPVARGNWEEMPSG